MNDMHNRLSFRSPLRRKSNVNANGPNVSNAESTYKQKPEIKPIIKKSSMTDRTSFRSPKRIQVKVDDTYKIVTKNPSGNVVKVPDIEKKVSFVKFIEKKIPMPIKQEVILECIKINFRKKYSFNEALIIYENNQAFYLDQIQKGNMEVLKEVDKMEKWFNKINEPKPLLEEDYEEWKERCEWKKVHHYSKYFDETLLSFTNFKC